MASILFILVINRGGGGREELVESYLHQQRSVVCHTAIIARGWNSFHRDNGSRHLSKLGDLAAANHRDSRALGLVAIGPLGSRQMSNFNFKIAC